MFNITNSQKLRANNCRFRTSPKVSNCNQAARRFHNLLSSKKHFLHDTQGVADSSSATRTILKAASLITYGFLFLLDKWGQCQMLRNTAAQSQRLWNKSYKEANFHSIPPHSTDAPWRQFSKSRPQARLWISFFLRRKPERF